MNDENINIAVCYLLVSQIYLYNLWTYKYHVDSPVRLTSNIWMLEDRDAEKWFAMLACCVYCCRENNKDLALEN